MEIVFKGDNQDKIVSELKKVYPDLKEVKFTAKNRLYVHYGWFNSMKLDSIYTLKKNSKIVFEKTDFKIKEGDKGDKYEMPIL